MGRKTKLNDDVQAVICQKIRECSTDAAAAQAGGIHRGTFINWMERGEKAQSGRFFDFFNAIMRARAEALVTGAAAIHSGAVGGETVEEYTEVVKETRTGKDGKPYTTQYEKTTIKRIKHPPDWRAGVEYLKRRDPDNWSEKARHELTVTIESAMETAADEFERLVRQGRRFADTRPVAGDADDDTESGDAV